MFWRTEVEIKKSGFNFTLSLKCFLDEPVEISPSPPEMGVGSSMDAGEQELQIWETEAHKCYLTFKSEIARARACRSFSSIEIKLMLRIRQALTWGGLCAQTDFCHLCHWWSRGHTGARGRDSTWKVWGFLPPGQSLHPQVSHFTCPRASLCCEMETAPPLPAAKAKASVRRLWERTVRYDRSEKGFSKILGCPPLGLFSSPRHGSQVA